MKALVETVNVKRIASVMLCPASYQVLTPDQLNSHSSTVAD